MGNYPRSYKINMNDFRKFLLQLTLLTAFLFGGQYVVFTFLLEKALTLPYLILYPWFIGLTGFVHFFLLRAGQKDHKKFVPVFMGFVGLKMFTCLAVLVIYIANRPEEAKPFAVSFMVLYFAYTAIEILAVLKALNKSK